MKSTMRRRIGRLEEALVDQFFAMKDDAPVVWGTPEHAAAITEGRIVTVIAPDEPSPANPIL